MLSAGHSTPLSRPSSDAVTSKRESVQPDIAVPLDRQVGRSAFGGDASSYHDARSGYSPEIFDYLSKRAVASPRVLEIGAGTGLASQGLLGCSPRDLTLVEPDSRLCSFLEQRFAGSAVRVICGVFPDVEVAGTFDLVVCAAAFHWMEPVAALGQIKSLLTPGGIWAMWWNCYFGHGMDDAFAERVAYILDDERVVLPPSYNGPSHYALDVEHHVHRLHEAGFGEVEHLLFRTLRQYDVRQVRALYQSFSFVHVLPPDVQTRILDRISDSVTTDFGGLASSVVVTSFFAAAT